MRRQTALCSAAHQCWWCFRTTLPVGATASGKQSHESQGSKSPHLSCVSSFSADSQTANSQQHQRRYSRKRKRCGARTKSATQHFSRVSVTIRADTKRESSSACCVHEDRLTNLCCDASKTALSHTHTHTHTHTSNDRQQQQLTHLHAHALIPRSTPNQVDLLSGLIDK